MVLAIPETDAIAFHAFCVIGYSGNFSTARFGADTQNLKDGDPVSIKFSTHSWGKIMQGNATGTQAEEGLTGVELTIDNDDELWEVMSNSFPLIYKVHGKTTQMISNGASEQIAKFLNDCRFYNAQFDKLTDQAEDPRWASCTVAENQKSIEAGQSVTVTFRNNTEGYRSVFWINYNGQPENYANLNVGEEFTVTTSVGHPWMFTDGPGNCIEMFQPKLGVSNFEIAAPSPEFGKE